MFRLTVFELAALSKESGFLTNPLEKALRLLDILSTLGTNNVTQNVLVLKGGSALNLFALDVPRLSVDVDLNYIGQLDRRAMLEQRRKVTAEIEKMFGGEYSIRRAMDAHALTQHEFRYGTLSGSTDMLKVEINYLQRQTILPVELNECRKLGQKVSFPCLTLEELAAGKIMALLRRYTARDLFDVFELAKGEAVKLNEPLLRSLVRVYGIMARESVFDLFRIRLDQLEDLDIRRNLVPMLRSGYDIPTRDEMARTVEDFLSPLLQLTDDEVAAIERFYATGDLDVEALFPKELHESIRKSPALQWKANTIKGHVAKEH
jgi:predicted nucleotidyltransferase component of viral defense system